MTIRFGDHRITWLGYACARIGSPDGPVVYTDPGRYGTLDGTWAEQYGGFAHPTGPAYDAADGDLVLVTHDHHYDSDGIRRVASSDATVVLFDAVDADRIREGGRDVDDPDELGLETVRVEPGERLTVAGVSIDVIPAYNLPDGPNVDERGEPIHPEGFGCGYRFAIEDTAYCWPGDSDVVPEHRDLDVSVLLPSISSSFTMDRHGAADLAGDRSPDLVVPIHYNTFESLRSDSRAFAGDVASRGVPVALDERGVTP